MTILDDLQAADAKLKETKKAQTKAIKEAKRAVTDAEKEKQNKIDALSKKVKELEDTRTKPSNTYLSVRVYANRVTYGTTTLYFNEPINVTVETSGNSYTVTSTKGGVGVSVGGAVVGGFIAGPIGAVVGGKKNKVKTESEEVDNRQLFITFTSNQGRFTVQGNPDQEAQARKFADYVLNAATNAKTDEEYQSELSNLNEQLDAAKNDNYKIDLAEKELKKAEEDTSAIDAVQQEIDTIVNNATPEEAADIERFYEKKAASQKRKKLIKIAIGVIAALVVIVIIGIFAFKQ